MQQGELEHCWLPLELCAVCSGDEQMLEESFISPLVSFFPPPGHPVSLETTLPCAELGYQCANPPHCGGSGQLLLCACRDHSQPHLVLAAQGHALKIKLHLGGSSGC